MKAKTQSFVASRIAVALWATIIGCALTICPTTTRAQETAPPDRAAAPEREDLLGWAKGAFTVRTPSPKRTQAHVVALDGLEQTTQIGVPRHSALPHEFVVELPAMTTFESFAIPVINEFGPAKGKHVKTVAIEGSTMSADEGFSLLTTFQIEIEQKKPQEFSVDTPRPVRWLKIRLVDRYTPQASDVDGVLFSELIGYGKQEPRASVENAFTGVWSLRRGYDVSRNLIELRQEGTQISGCQVVGGQHGEVSGTVVDGLARLVITTKQGKRTASTPSIALITSEGELHGVSSLHAGLRPYSGVPSKEGITTPCSEVPEPKNPVSEALKAGLTAILYGINFDVDSDVLRPDAKPALEQIEGALKANTGISVVIEGHTDSDGSDAHNLDLSQRRAQSVVSWLKEKGIDDARLTALGKGEGEPIASNDSAVGKAMNRRVEVEPK